ncbi:MAG: TIGR02996 domain-containing protein [Planctomycetes bacterium]|nr:TIGR02996 domain-containing protein [Planctomycetota bacterium]
MSTESALLAAILAQPDEDTPRLAYADWLDEHADALPGRDPKAVRARAEFIRLQIAFHRRDEDPDFDGARDRTNALRARHGEVWTAWDPQASNYAFWNARRGFPDQTGTELAVLPHLADDAVARAPVTKLRGTITPDLCARLAACPHLSRVRRLELTGAEPVTRDDLDVLFHSPRIIGLRELWVSWAGDHSTLIAEAAADSEWLAELESFEFWQNQFTTGAAVALGRSKHLRLRKLTGWCSDCNDTGISALAGSHALARTEQLNLRGCKFGPAGAIALARAPHLGPLWYLELGGTKIGAEGVTALARCPRLAGLRVLGLDLVRPGSKGLAELARSEHLRELRRLELYHNALHAAGAIVAEGPAFARLRALNLGDNRIGDSGLGALARSSVLGALERLALSGCGIKEAGAKALADGDGLRALTHLELGHNRVGAAGAESLAGAGRFPRLRVLSLRNNFLGDAGATALAKSPHLEALEELNLRSNKIGDAGGRALLESPHFKNLKRLDLSHNKMSPALKNAIAKRFEQPE